MAEVCQAFKWHIRVSILILCKCGSLLWQIFSMLCSYLGFHLAILSIGVTSKYFLISNWFFFLTLYVTFRPWSLIAYLFINTKQLKQLLYLKEGTCKEALCNLMSNWLPYTVDKSWASRLVCWYVGTSVDLKGAVDGTQPRQCTWMWECGQMSLKTLLFPLFLYDVVYCKPPLDLSYKHKEWVRMQDCLNLFILLWWNKSYKKL